MLISQTAALITYCYIWRGTWKGVMMGRVGKKDEIFRARNAFYRSVAETQTQWHTDQDKKVRELAEKIIAELANTLDLDINYVTKYWNGQGSNEENNEERISFTDPEDMKHLMLLSNKQLDRLQAHTLQSIANLNAYYETIITARAVRALDKETYPNG